jgi:hypothetical protein
MWFYYYFKKHTTICKEHSFIQKILHIMEVNLSQKSVFFI